MIRVELDALNRVEADLARFDTDSRKKAREAIRKAVNPGWQRVMQRQIAGSPLQTQRTFRQGQVAVTDTGVVFTALPGVGMSGLRFQDLGKPTVFWMQLTDYGSKRGYGRSGQLPRHQASGRVVKPALKKAVGWAVQCYLWALAETTREALGVDDG